MILRRFLRACTFGIARFVRGVSRIFWKELFELFQKPVSTIGLIILSILIVWLSGQINANQPITKVLIYKGGVSEELLNEARKLIYEFAHTAVMEIDAISVDPDAMQALGATLAITYRNGSWLVLHRFATARQEAEAAQLAGMMAYSLRANRPLSTLLAVTAPEKITIDLYVKEIEDDVLERVRSVLGAIPNVAFKEIAEDGLDLAGMPERGANVALIRGGGVWFLFQRFTSAVQAASAAPTIGVVAFLLNPNSDTEFEPAWSRLITPAQQGSISRLSALPGEPKLELVPRTLALIVVFLPFVLSARSFSREVTFNTLPFLLSLPGGGWGAVAVGKLFACVATNLAMLLILLLAMYPLSGFAPKSELALQLAAQALAMVTSGCLGLIVSVQTRNQTQIYLMITVYLLVLVLVSGFLFPLETASTAVRAASYLSPLTFSGKVLESWLFFGTSPLVFTNSLTFLVIQAIGAIALLSGSIRYARRHL
jgi:ABC-type multidrug transport system permease subunit